MPRPFALFVLVLLLCGGCEEGPFLPDTGVPVSTPSQRSTPTGAIDQLLSAYKNRRIDLFEDLFPKDGGFRFYVSPQLLEEGTDVTISSEEIAAGYDYVAEGTYHYWTYDNEKRSHERLFDEAVSIELEAWPIYDEEDFVYRLNDRGDTIGVEILMLGGQMDIGVQIDPATTFWYPVAIERQVFYLRRDSEGLWVIQKWFDFGTASG